MPVNTVVTGEVASDEWANDVANFVNLLETEMDAAQSSISTLGTTLGTPTSSATANRIIKRDANGRAQVASPSAGSDIANKTYVDGLTQRIGARRSRGSQTIPAASGDVPLTFPTSEAGGTGITYTSGHLVTETAGIYCITARVVHGGSGTINCFFVYYDAADHNPEVWFNMGNLSGSAGQHVFGSTTLYLPANYAVGVYVNNVSASSGSINSAFLDVWKVAN